MAQAIGFREAIELADKFSPDEAEVSVGQLRLLFPLRLVALQPPACEIPGGGRTC
jgi:hypothetical protein